MKSFISLSVLLVLFAVTSVPTANADSPKMVTVTNDTATDMDEFYASVSDNADWDLSNNLLSGQTIAPGATSTITINDGLDACTYDLMAVLYGSANHGYEYQVNVCNGNSAHWDVTGQ